MTGGIYIYRCRKPGAVFGWPIIGRHFAYVGETTSFHHREKQHMDSQPWSDLAPRCYRIPLPAWKPLLHAVETLVILVLWPVYNHSKNLWNPRRITLGVAKQMRQARDRRRFVWVYRVWLGLRNLFVLAAFSVTARVLWEVWHAR